MGVALCVVITLVSGFGAQGTGVRLIFAIFSAPPLAAILFVLWLAGVIGGVRWHVLCWMNVAGCAVASIALVVFVFPLDAAESPTAFVLHSLTASVAALTAMGCAAIAWYVFRRHTRLAAEATLAGCCRRCGYSLRALRARVCPECGLQISMEEESLTPPPAA